MTGTGVTGRCHCGALQFRLPNPPEWVASCNCSICTKLGTLMAYYPDGAVTVSGESSAYIWGDQMIRFHFCPTCGCHSHWSSTGEGFGRQGFNARLIDDFDSSAVEIRPVENR